MKLRKIGKRNTQKKGCETEKNLNMESDQPEIKVIAPLHEMPPLPTTENIMKTLNSDKEPNENKTVTETETETRSLSLMSDFRKDAKGNGNEADLGQDTGQDTRDETEKKDARTEENGMKEDDDEVQHDTLEFRTVNEIFTPVADLRQDTRNETEKNADFQSQTPLQDLNKDMESSVSLIGLEIIWVFKGGGIGTWWIRVGVGLGGDRKRKIVM